MVNDDESVCPRVESPLFDQIDLASDLQGCGNTSDDLIVAPTGAKGASDKGDKKAGPRLRRCGKCLPCNRGDCGSCHNCADKPKFGGSGVKKQACVARRCLSMLRRDSTPSPPLGEEIGASPSSLLDFWDPANWDHSLNEQLGEEALAADDVNEASTCLLSVDDRCLSYPDMLSIPEGRRLLQQGGALPDSSDSTDELSLQIAWSESCLAAIELGLDGELLFCFPLVSLPLSSS